MSAAKRLTACLIVMVTCLAGLLAVRDWPSAHTPCDVEMILPPGEEVQLLARRSQARRVVLDQLLAGELSLVQAAARFRHLNEIPPDRRASLNHWDGKSDGEKLCRQVIHWANSHLQSKGTKPDEIEAALCSLRCELERLLMQHDEIELPPVDEPGREPEKW